MSNPTISLFSSRNPIGANLSSIPITRVLSFAPADLDEHPARIENSAAITNTIVAKRFILKRPPYLLFLFALVRYHVIRLPYYNAIMIFTTIALLIIEKLKIFNLYI